MKRGVTLGDLVREGAGRAVVGDAATVVRGVRHDSREIEPGDLFVALSGAQHDGARFVRDAIARGAAAVLATSADGVGAPVLLADDPRRALALAAAAVYAHPTFALDVVGVTGTNGKTTTTHLLEAALAAAGARPALVGTVAMRAPGIERTTPFTTPEADAISRFAREALDRGATHLLMEVSSHALAQHRVDAVRFRVAALTNLTQDHLDFHGTMEAYAAAKATLFHELHPAAAVINVDDAFGQKLARDVSVPLWRVSTRADADAEVRALRVTMGRDGIRATVRTPSGDLELVSPLIGAHNLENLLVALACGLALEVDPQALLRGLATSPGAPGLLERVADPRGVAVLVDYAHTPDALARALAALRPLTPGRLFVVFGCGGDRDRTKRPQMGEAAAKGADVLVVTTDNPRTEPPARILEEIVPGVESASVSRVDAATLRGSARGYVVVEDRRTAIGLAVAAAKQGDTVLVAGKGHEDYQIVGTEKRPFDDRVVAREAIAAAAGGGA